MINLEVFGDLAEIPAGDYKPKPTTLTPGQEEALHPLWMSIDGLTKVGIWDCTPGRFTADRSAMAELCHVLSGSATVTNRDGGCFAGDQSRGICWFCQLGGAVNGRYMNKCVRPTY